MEPLISVWIPEGVTLIKGWFLLEAWCLLEEIWEFLLVLNTFQMFCLLLE